MFPIILIIISMILEVWFLIVSKKTLSHVEPLNYTFYSFTIASVAFFPFALFSMLNSAPLIINQATLFSLLYAVFFSSIAAYFLYSYGLHILNGNKASILGFIDPIAAFIVAPLLLNEMPTHMQIFGLILIAFGVWWAEHKFLHVHGAHHGVHRMK